MKPKDSLWFDFAAMVVAIAASVTIEAVRGSDGFTWSGFAISTVCAAITNGAVLIWRLR